MTTLESIARAQDKTHVLVEQLTKKVEDRIEHTDSWRERTDMTLYGDGNGFRGYNVRVDRLEQRAAFQSKLIWVLAGGFGSLLLKLLNELV